MTQAATWVGVDICQAQLDLYLLPQGTRLQFANTEAEGKALIEQLQPLSVQLVVAEATGGLERTLVEGL